MNIYLVKRREGSCGWGQYESFVCSAESEEDARKLCPQENASWNDELGIFVLADSVFEAEEWPVTIQELKVTCWGQAQEGREAGIVLSSFYG